MKVAILKPASENRARIELDFTHEEFDVARAFNPASVKIVKETAARQESLEFEVKVGSTNKLSKYALVVASNPEAPTSKIVVQVDVANISSPAGTATLVRAKGLLDTISKQILKAVKDYKAAAETIEEV